MLPIIRSDRADEDLIGIWLFVAHENPAAADRVVDGIAQRWAQLARHPNSGVAREEIAPGIRHPVAGRYMVLYRIGEEAVEIVRVPHGRRKLPDVD